MHWTFLAPELSATSSIVLGWIMVSSRHALAVWRSALGDTGEDLADPPPLLPGQRTRLLDEDPVPDLGGIRLVVRLEPLGARHHPLVAGMAEHPLDDDHAGLGHLVAH